MLKDNKPNNLKPIRIAHVAGGLTSGGVEGVVYNYFAAIENKNDYDLVYISYDTPDPTTKAKFEKIGFTVYSVTKKYENLFKSCKEVADIFKKHKINVVHSHMTLMSFITSIIGGMCGVKVRIAHSHLAQYPKGIKRIVYAFFKLFSRVSSNYWFACGKQAGEYLYGKKAVENGKVTILNNAVPPEKYMFNQTAKDAIKQRYAVGDSMCIGHLARFTEQKNHTFLIDIFNEIYKKRQDVMLLLLGNGPLMDEIKQKVEKLNLGNAVVFGGTVKDAGDCYSAMDIMILPSLYEGLAVVLVEAQFAGMPILVSTTVTPEIGITDSMQYLPLERGAEYWAKQALALLPPPKRVDNYKTMADAGYDIYKESIKLDEFYHKALTC